MFRSSGPRPKHVETARKRWKHSCFELRSCVVPCASRLALFASRVALFASCVALFASRVARIRANERERARTRAHARKDAAKSARSRTRLAAVRDSNEDSSSRRRGEGARACAQHQPRAQRADSSHTERAPSGGIGQGISSARTPRAVFGARFFQTAAKALSKQFHTLRNLRRLLPLRLHRRSRDGIHDYKRNTPGCPCMPESDPTNVASGYCTDSK